MSNPLQRIAPSATLVSHLALGWAAAIMLAGCDTSEPADDGGPTTGPYQIEMTHLPGDIHPGDVVTFTFKVTRDGVPVTGLTPEAQYQQATGDSVDWALAGRTTPDLSGHGEVHGSQADLDLAFPDVRRAQVTLDAVDADRPSDTVILSGETTDPRLAPATAPTSASPTHQH